jgi:hypothetical protein
MLQNLGIETGIGLATAIAGSFICNALGHSYLPTVARKGAAGRRQ